MAQALQEEQKVTFPEIRDYADGYAEAAEAEAEAAAEDGSAIDVDIEDMVWEVETEAPDDTDSGTYNEELRSYDHYDRPYDGAYDDVSAETYDESYNGRVFEEYEEIPYERKMNKHIFTWVFNCLLGMYGVDRFIRGQIPLGIFKILTFGGFGFWYLADLGVAIYKSYMSPDANMSEDLHFDRWGRYV